MNEEKWPRMRDLPEKERAPFMEWMAHQTMPLVEGIPMEEQDFYYPWDYKNWKSKNPVWD